MKVCRTCGQEKSVDEYWVCGGHQSNGTPKTSLLRDCQACVRSIKTAAYQAKKARLAVTGVSVATKVCKDCHQDKPADEFYRHPASSDGLLTVCKTCQKARAALSRATNPRPPGGHRKSFLMRRYGITMDQFDQMVEAQQGCCAICGRLVDQLVVDHDHATGAIRELACATCNSGIGMFGDDPDLLERAIAYLRKHQSVT